MSHARLFRTALTAAALAVVALAAQPAGAAYPGKNGRIAFVRPPTQYRDYSGDIWTVTATGASPLRLTRSGDNNSPVWSPNGKLIAFDSHRSGNWDIWVMNANGTNPRRITSAPTSETDPTWSPDGRWIAFSSDRITTSADEPRAALFKLRSTAPYGAAIQLTHPGLDEFGMFDLDVQPDWSPLGGVIMFTRVSPFPGEPSASELRTVPAAGGATRAVLPENGAVEWWGSWSAGGRAIAWSSDADSPGYFEPPLNIWMRTASGAIRRLTPARASYYTEAPAWAPDGTRIAYDRVNADTDASAILTIKPDGSGARVVITNGVTPDWQPITG